MTEEKIHKERHGSWWALSPLLVFLCLYLVTSILVNDFYKVPITVAFLVSSCYAIAITRGLKLEQRIYQFSVGAANKNILLMIWIFILAGAFAQSAKQMGALDATVNLTLHILPDNLLLAEIVAQARPRNDWRDFHCNNSLGDFEARHSDYLFALRGNPQFPAVVHSARI